MSNEKTHLEITVKNNGYNVESKTSENATNQDFALMLMALKETEHSLLNRRLEEIK